MTNFFKKIFSLNKYFKDIIKLAIPVMVGFLGNVLINIADVIVAGRHSTLALASISVASAISMTFIIIGIGLVSGVAALVSNLRGERKSSRSLIKPTLKYAAIAACFVFLAIWVVIFFLPFINLKDNLTPYVREYLVITSFSVFPVCIFAAIKDFLLSYEIVKFPNIVAVIGVITNVILNIVLVFGFYFVPPLGVCGLAYATLLTRIIMALLLLIYCVPYFKLKVRKNKNFLKNLLKIGWPIATAHFVEFVGFNITAVLVGTFSALYAAAHNVIITISGATFAIPLAISSVISVKVGFYFGRKNREDIKKYYSAGLILSIIFELLVMFCILAFPEALIKIFTGDIKVFEATRPVINLVACYLIFDGIQVATMGALRGFKKTKAIMFTMITSYFVIGIPIGCTLAYKYCTPLKGFWIGLTLALFSTSVISFIFYIYYYKKLTKNF